MFLAKEQLSKEEALQAVCFHGLLQNIWESSELKIVDIHFSLPAMEQRQVRLAVWRRRLWLIMGRTLMPTIV